MIPPDSGEEVVQSVPTAFAEAVAKVDAAQPSQKEISEVLPEECAVEVTNVLGEKRIDYKRIPIKNADGTPNKYGKVLVEMHEKAAQVGADVVDKLQAGDYDDKPEQAFERERKQPLDPEVALRVADHRELRPVRGHRFRGRCVFDETGTPNLWRDREGRLWRMALVGTERKSRVEVYPA